MTRTFLHSIWLLGLVSWPQVSAFAAEGKNDGKASWIRTAQSGAWSSATTWEGGKVPGVGARVQIREGHAVVYDRNSDQAIRTIHIAGTLVFARDRTTRLDVGLIKIQPGEDADENGFDCDAHIPDREPGKPQPALEIGTPDEPIPAKYYPGKELTQDSWWHRHSCLC